MGKNTGIPVYRKITSWQKHDDIVAEKGQSLAQRF